MHVGVPGLRHIPGLEILKALDGTFFGGEAFRETGTVQFGTAALFRSRVAWGRSVVLTAAFLTVWFVRQIRAESPISRV